MFSKKALFMLLIICIMGTFLYAQNEGTVVFVTYDWENKIDPVTGESPDMPHIYALQDAGYDVITFYNGSLSTASEETLDTLYNANLIVHGRSTPSPSYGDHKETWHEITTPMLNVELWNARNSRLNWFDTGALISFTDTLAADSIFFAIIEMPDDPVFEGIDTANPVPWIQGPYDGMDVTDGGNAIVLATSEIDSTIWFARFEPDVEFYDGAGEMPAGHRSIIGNGRDEGSNAPFMYYNFTDESEQVFLAEAERLFILGGGEAPSSVEEPEITTAPLTYVLSQNYPNPFNPETQIDFSLEKSGHATIQVFNAAGQLIETLADQYFGAGTHTIHFQANDLSTGVYFYRIKADNFTDIKKMILLK